MLSLSSLLNPAPPGPPRSNGFPPSPELSSPADSCVEDSVFLDRSAMPKHKMPKDAAVFTKSKPKGAINFQPFEELDELSLHRVRKFQVYPLGKIREYSRHIPYNSGKKDFFEKTGRESFEVFQYVFKLPGDDAEYAVMWDYNVGLVRMTPFFKCCKYPKTTPAKMLNSNPGLKEITHSITGGSIMAQGYWMPYQCAKAVCATFCHNISGALIPIFGPDFPALCIQVDTPEYSRMVIDPAIVVRSTREAEYYRRLYSNTATSGSVPRNESDTIATISPKRDRRAFRSPFDDTSRHHPRYRIRKTYITTPGSENSPYTTDTDGEVSPVTDRASLFREPPHQPPRSCTRRRRPSPRVHGKNEPYEPPRTKRPVEDIKDSMPSNQKQQGTGAEQNQIPSIHHIDTGTRMEVEPPRTREDDKPGSLGTLGADKNAALLLMNLSVRDRSFWTSVRKSQDVEGPGLHNDGVRDAANSKYGSNDCGRRLLDISNLGDNPNDRNSRYQTGTGTMAKIGSDGVSSETTSPFGGAISRMKRIRSNSM
ncbi:hypothetical protein O1611_g9748 [Lasiodiplodia mahajangana]|uniref:Uncharacterized protein n=1 Tax=Lasiodiplodia mahajangana TaxID=1108764 RepID=A0ACC2J5X0_9PEZI|nr:hypothetical protein O1611_g9748 [Lasiodiplodia mahajangana]